MATAQLPLRKSRFAPLVRPVEAFLAAEASGGLLLFGASIVAAVWANSPWAGGYVNLWHTPLGIHVGNFNFALSLEHWINDGLMAVFFLLVGLEIKREIVLGELASWRRAALPVAAAIGGMVVPALIYLSINARGAARSGWAIPMATDIAFAVGVLALVGKGVPPAMKVLLLAIAIVDDLGAVIVIAAFYTADVSMIALAVAGLFLAGLVLLNLMRVHDPLTYVLLGVGLWAAMLASGIHATIAGVLLAFTIPATRQIEERPYHDEMRRLLSDFDGDVAATPDRITDEQSHALNAMEQLSQAVQTPLARLEHALLRPVNFLIMPLFALANAGVNLRGGLGEALYDRVTWGVLLGLLLGKPIGVIVASAIAAKTGIASVPAGATRQQFVGIALLCGIGFTMSLFLANLAFPGDEAHRAAAKLAILAASIAAGLAGAAVITLGRSSRSDA